MKKYNITWNIVDDSELQEYLEQTLNDYLHIQEEYKHWKRIKNILENEIIDVMTQLKKKKGKTKEGIKYEIKKYNTKMLQEKNYIKFEE